MLPGARPPPAALPVGLAVLRRGLRVVALAERHLAAATFLAVVVLSCTEVAMRYLLHASLWWSQEVALLMMLVAYFFGASYVFKTRQYVVVDLLVQRLPSRLQVRLYLFAQALIGLVATVIVVEALALAPSELEFYTYILGIPKFYSTLPLLLAALSILVTSLYYGLAIHWLARVAGGRRSLADLEAEALVLQGIAPE